ncbi:MAG: hypothetical protein KDC38_00995 [Planctomycetes bacterium]|nr:hypothetical protein [Planctomycetota bacterium]
MARASWFDEKTEVPHLDQKVHELESFTNAMADGKVDKHELESQQERLIAAMKAVEPALDDATHAKVTDLLVELTAYDIMRTLHELQVERLRGKFA